VVLIGNEQGNKGKKWKDRKVIVGKKVVGLFAGVLKDRGVDRK